MAPSSTVVDDRRVTIRDLIFVEEGSMPEHVLPFYLVCDESYSMTAHLDTLNGFLRGLYEAVTTDRRVADKSRLCLIGFSGTAKVLMPLSRPQEVTELTGLTARATSNFGAAFTLLRQTISQDVETLNAMAHVVYRPVVFFLSDGQPTDPASWRAAYDRLIDEGWPARPRMVAFGIGDADPVTIRRIGTFKTYLDHSDMTPGAVVRKLVHILTSSIVMSGKSTSEARCGE
jgi:uncharacterized protein YegL